MKREDLVGKTFGYWTVTGDDPENRKRMMCRCVCGTEKSIGRQELRQGKSKSCGCVNLRGRKLRFDIIGKRYGRLVVIGDDIENGKVVCRCDCGNVVSVRRSLLYAGNTKSCGCLFHEMVKDRPKKSFPNFEANKLFNTCFDIIENRSVTSKTASSGYKGIYFDGGKYRAKITLHYHTYDLGRYDNIDDALKARRDAEEKYFAPLIEAKNTLQTESE